MLEKDEKLDKAFTLCKASTRQVKHIQKFEIFRRSLFEFSVRSTTGTPDPPNTV